MNLIAYDEELCIRPVGFNNNGVICYFNSMLQSLLSCTSFIDKIKNTSTSNPVIKYLKELITLHMELLKSPDIDNVIKKRIHAMSIDIWKVMVLVNKKKNKDFTFNGQQCASEGYNHLMESIDDVFEIKNLFTHRYNTNLYCFDCSKWISSVNSINNIFTIDPELHVYQLDRFTAMDKFEENIFTELYNLCDLSDFNKYMIKQNSFVDADYKCPKCEKKGEKYKLNYLVMIPEILIVMAKKYDNNLKKKYIMTDFPKHLIFKGNNGLLKYEAVSQIEHSGNLNSGHYWAISKRKNGKWYMLNDMTVNESEFKPTENTYIVVYHVIL